MASRFARDRSALLYICTDRLPAKSAMCEYLSKNHSHTVEQSSAAQHQSRQVRYRYGLYVK